MFLVLGVAISNSILAKVPTTRHIIDHYLGDKFVSEHKVNTKAIQLGRLVAGFGGAYLIRYGDDYFTTKANIQALKDAHEVTKVTGSPLTSEQQFEILRRPSGTQQILTKTLETAHDVAVPPQVAKNTTVTGFGPGSSGSGSGSGSGSSKV